MAREPQDEASFIDEVYIDETSWTNHRFLIVGGIRIPSILSHQFEADIIKARVPKLALRFDSEMQLNEMGWADVSKGDFEHYKKVIDAYFSFGKRYVKSASDSVQFYCSVVDTAVRGRKYTGKKGQLGFNREIYFHCMTIARRRRAKLFHVYADERNTDMTMDQMRTILCRGLRKEFPLRPKAFRRVKFRKSHEMQALQISDLLIGAVAYRLNGHFDKPGGHDKNSLCEYILRKGDFWRFISKTGFKEKPFGAFQVWFRRHKS
jgi:Protein of unknown function (DUF3800)